MSFHKTCFEQSSKYENIMNKFSYLWNTDKFYVQKKPKYWKAVFTIFTTPNHLWNHIISNVLVAHGNTEDSAISKLKKLVDKRVSQQFSSLRIDGKQFGFSESEIENEGVKFWLEYNNYDPHKKDVFVYDISSQKLIERIPV